MCVPPLDSNLTFMWACHVQQPRASNEYTENTKMAVNPYQKQVIPDLHVHMQDYTPLTRAKIFSKVTNGSCWRGIEKFFENIHTEEGKQH